MKHVFSRNIFLITSISIPDPGLLSVFDMFGDWRSLNIVLLSVGWLQSYILAHECPMSSCYNFGFDSVYGLHQHLRVLRTYSGTQNTRDSKEQLPNITAMQILVNHKAENDPTLGYLKGAASFMSNAIQSQHSQTIKQLNN